MKYLLLIALILIGFTVYWTSKREVAQFTLPRLETVDDLPALFPENEKEIGSKGQDAIKGATRQLEAIYAIPAQKRTFKNTIQAIDLMFSGMHVAAESIYVLTQLSPQEKGESCCPDGFA